MACLKVNMHRKALFDYHKTEILKQYTERNKKGWLAFK